jgi:hypothetical protein
MLAASPEGAGRRGCIINLEVSQAACRKGRSSMFNPKAELKRVRFGDQQTCFVVDDALVDPDQLVNFCVSRRHEFQPIPGNAYPGICLAAPEAVVRHVNALFVQHMRRMFDARRLVSFHSRLSIVSLPPSELRPYQWLCHRDGALLNPRQSIQAAVLYLFKDEELGGTSFYEPTHSLQETIILFDDARKMTSDAFVARYGIEPGYMCESNQYFNCVGTVPARWNRLIFYDGSLLHSGHIAAPEKLHADPLKGRLTLNNFFTSRRNLV